MEPPEAGSPRGRTRRGGDRSATYATRVIPATVRDATYVLDGILDNETELPIVEHTTDTAVR